MGTKGITNNVLKSFKGYACGRETLYIDPRVNKRSEYGDVFELAVGIKLDALSTGYVPGLVYVQSNRDDDRVTVTDGHRRVQAYDLLMSDPVKFELTDKDIELLNAARFRLLLEKDNELSTALARQIKSNRGKPFEPFEQAAVLKALEEDGKTREEIHEMTGLSSSLISERIALLVLPEKTVEFIAENQISTRAGLKAVRLTKDVPAEERPDVLDDVMRSAKGFADEEQVKVDKQHVEMAAATRVLPRNPAIKVAKPLERADLIERLADFDWNSPKTGELRRIWAIASKVVPDVEPRELPQREVDLDLLAARVV